MTRFPLEFRQVDPDNFEDLGLWIVGTDASNNANRTVLNGTGNGSGDMELQISYTPL